MSAGELNVTEERKKIIRWTIGQISMWAKGRKLSPGLLTEQATGGFNLACDFLADELRKLDSIDTEELLDTD